MMDIVERLREHNEPPFDYIAHEAASEIEKLRLVLELWASFWKLDGDDVWAGEEAMEATNEILGKNRRQPPTTKTAAKPLEVATNPRKG